MDGTDEWSLNDIREIAHCAWNTGTLWIFDELSVEDRGWHIIWMDEFGEIIRERRLDIWDLEANLMTFGWQTSEHEWWCTARVGEKFKHGRWPLTSIER